MRKKLYDIPNILESCRRDYESGTMSLHECAETLAQHGWNFGIIDDEKTLRLMYM